MEAFESSGIFIRPRLLHGKQRQLRALLAHFIHLVVHEGAGIQRKGMDEVADHFRHAISSSFKAFWGRLCGTITFRGTNRGSSVGLPARSSVVTASFTPVAPVAPAPAAPDAC